jgi:hypothetical protein
MKHGLHRWTFRVKQTAIFSSQEYCSLAGNSVNVAGGQDLGHGYAALPPVLVAAEQSLVRQAPALAFKYNKKLCQNMLDQFCIKEAGWTWPEQFNSLYRHQLSRIESQLIHEPECYFSFSNDPFRKDLALLRHRLIPFGAELATPFSGIPRSLLLRGGWEQAAKFMRVIAFCRGTKPFLELHMHPRDTNAFNPEGWLATYDNLADFLEVNPSLLGVQSTSWFLDPALEQISPHLAYLRQVPERCGATILYAGDDTGKNSGAFATSLTRRDLYAAGHYHPRLFTRIWPRQKLIQRSWRRI